MKFYSYLIILLFTLSSCEALRYARTGTRIAAGKITSYTADYTFDKDSIVIDKVFPAIETYFESKHWTISRESENMMNFEYSVAPIDQTATGRIASGSANFTNAPTSDKVKLMLRLRGNYQFGTKKKSQTYYSEIRELLYGKNVPAEEEAEKEEE